MQMTDVVTPMNSYFPFTQADFAHLDPETAYTVEYIVNRRDFQQGVAEIREVCGMRSALKFDGRKLSRSLDPLRPTTGSDVVNCEPNPAIDREVGSVIDRNGKRHDLLWCLLLHSYAKFGIIPHLNFDEPESRPASLKKLKTLYGEADRLLFQGKSFDFVDQWLGSSEWRFSDSREIIAYSQHGSVVMHIKPSASEKAIRDVLTASKSYRSFFRSKGKHGSKNALRPSILKEMVIMSEGGASSENIAAHLKREYRISRSATAVRKDIERARRMGL